MNNPNDVTRLKHLDSLAAAIAGGASSNTNFKRALSDIFVTPSGAVNATDFDNALNNIFVTSAGSSTCTDLDNALGEIFGTED